MAVVRLIRKFAPAMANKRSGVIINNGSIYGKQANARTPVFCVTKSALMMLTKCLSMDLINYNIRVNGVLPGPVWVEPHTRQYFESLADSQGNKHTWDQYAHASAQNLPLKRWATPSEIANFITFLCSPLVSYCVGSNYYIDGGTVNIV
jgi:NAD(P)-dependent dehydrogenase (short-subunit alcohol dehydrogenase family)